MKPKIVVVGSFNADLTSYMERMPKPGETVNGREFITGPGGKGSNQAVAAARLGADVTFIGRIGDDVFAPIALNLWKQEGIDTSYVVQDPEHATGVAPIFVDNSGENSIVVILGANLAISRDDIDSAIEAIKQADVLITQLETNHDTAGYALKVAKEHGVTTILNPAPAGELSPETISLADYITPNETELEVLAGNANTELESSARSLITRDGQTIVMTLGAKGAMYVTESDLGNVPRYSVDVVDTTGAGDAFNGGLGVALAEGKDLATAVRFANATAALCVTKRGTAPSMPYRNEVDDFLADK